jgi:predicted Rossmann fold nucleotide-binding protein DprA/Smf involved in DNA uptake
MTGVELRPDTQAILLLCGTFGRHETGAAPLSPTEYHALALWLYAHQMRPGDLLLPDGASALRTSPDVPVNPERLTALLARGGALALSVERWVNKGLWVMSRSDADYPQRLKKRLGHTAPPLLYGAGNRQLLEQGGLAILGSRNSAAHALAFTRRIAGMCARQGMPVLSGAARGVDSEAMQAALDARGVVIGVLADSLLKAAVGRNYRQAVRNGNLVLVSACDPEAGFTVGNAMGRNKYIYALSDYALVVSAALGEGGAWSGAVENLAKRWVPLFVWIDDELLPGNQRLRDMGALPFSENQCAGESVHDLFKRLADETTPQHVLSGNGMVASSNARASDGGHAEEQTASAGDQTKTNLSSEQQVLELTAVEANTSAPTVDLFPIVWPYLEQALYAAQTERELAQRCGIEPTQARAWLQRAVQEGLVARLTRPTRYVIASPITRHA